MKQSPLDWMHQAFQAAVQAADPLQMLAQYLPSLRPDQKVVVIGAGKAAARMAQAVEQAWQHHPLLTGLVVTRYGHALELQRIQCLEAAHPVPDEASLEAATRMMQIVDGLAPTDLLLVLLSGGGSSLLTLPIDPITLEEWQEVTRQLLRSGASIQEINVVRKHASAILGGRLAERSCAPIHCLILSDVADDDISSIASGPTAPDPSTLQDMHAILTRYHITLPDRVQQILQQAPETPKADHPCFQKVHHQIIGSAAKSLAAAASYLRAQGMESIILGDAVTGEAREVAKVYAAITQQIRRTQHPFKPPLAILSGGECSVTVRGQGRGGRCSEFLLSFLFSLGATTNVHALAADTDGIDGTETNAGAWWSTSDDFAKRLPAQEFQKALDQNDAWGFFDRFDRLVVTGPTHTNVNDFRIILITEGV